MKCFSLISGWLKAVTAALVAALPLLLPASCQRQSLLTRNEQVGRDAATLGVTIEFPETPSTRAGAGELPASEAENQIHSLTVWVFRSDDHTLVTDEPLVLEEADFPVGGGTRRYSLPVDHAFAAEKPDVDVFALANAAAFDAGLSQTSDWDALVEAFFTNSDTAPYYGFGLDHPVHGVDTSLGLPMSGCGLGLTIEGEEPVLKVRTIKIQRAVSRLRFVFCKTRTEGDDSEVSIDKVTLYGGQIALKEYVFTEQPTGVVIDSALPYVENYDSNSYIVSGPDTIAENDTPESLIYVNQDPLTYEAMLDDAVAGGQLTDLGYTYFRESDRRLLGRIDYTVNGQSKSHEFGMAGAGDFARNHTWTVFGYFLSGRNLQLALNVLPWDYNSFLVDFSEESVNVPSKFVVDESTVNLVNTSKDHYNAYLIPGVAAKGHLTITTPVGGRLMIRPQGNTEAFEVIPEVAYIDPTVNGGRIDILIRRADVSGDLSGSYITLSFFVEVGDRPIDAESEIVDAVYTFIL